MKNLLVKFKKVKNDRLLFISMHLSYAFLLLHFLCRNDVDIRMPFIVRCIAILLYTPTVILFHRKGATFWTVLYACLMFFFTSVHNYTPFIMLVLLTKNSIHRHKIISFSVYIIIFIIKSYLEPNALEMGIHIIKCLLLFYLIFTIFRETKPLDKKAANNLVLTSEEVSILKQLSNGMRINEISGYSSNTVSRKLKKARERNNLKTNKELIDTFFAQTDRF